VVRVDHELEPCKTDESIEMPFGHGVMGPKEPSVRWGPIGATWRIRSNDLLVAAVRPMSKLFDGK